MRVKRGFAGRRRRRKLLKLSEGFRGRRKNCFKLAKRSVQKALKFAYRDRKVRSRDFRSLWITRINAAVRLNGISYSRFILGLRKASIEVDRKVLAELAVADPKAFAEIAKQAAAAL